MDGPLEVNVIVYPSDRRREIDNVRKALLDALQYPSVYDGDSQIARLSIDKGDPVEGPRTIVRIHKVSE